MNSTAALRRVLDAVDATVRLAQFAERVASGSYPRGVPLDRVADGTLLLRRGRLWWPGGLAASRLGEAVRWHETAQQAECESDYDTPCALRHRGEREAAAKASAVTRAAEGGE